MYACMTALQYLWNREGGREGGGGSELRTEGVRVMARGRDGGGSE